MKCWRAERERHWGKHDARRDLDSTALERNRKWLVASLFCGNLETMLGEIDTTATTYFWNGKPAGNNQHVERGVWFFKVPATAGNDSETLRTICRDLYVGDLDSLSKFRFSFDFLNNYQLLDLLSLPLSRPETIDVRKIHPAITWKSFVFDRASRATWSLLEMNSLCWRRANLLTISSLGFKNVDLVQFPRENREV